MKKKARFLAPKAAPKPKKIVTHGHARIDEYAWLQESKNPEVLSYIKAENDYADASMAATKTLQQKLYKEIKARMKEDDMSVPVQHGPYYYYTRTKKGMQYAIHCRRKGERGKEEIILDENKLANGQKYFALGDIEVSPDHSLIAYSSDTTGAERYTLQVKDLRTGRLMPEKMESVGDFEWATDNTHLFYTVEEHPHPPRRILRHQLGTPITEDALVYEEKDLQWYVSVGKTNDRKYILVLSANFDTTEIRFLKADAPTSALELVAPRKRSIKYYVEHYGGDFYILTNEKAINFKIMRAGVEKFQKKYWKLWMPHRTDRAINGFQPFHDFFVVTLREGGSEEIYIHEPGKAIGKRIALPEKAHTLSLWSDSEFTTASIRFTYQSLLVPRIVYDFVVSKRKLVVKKKQTVPGWKPERFASARVWAKSGSVRVPISLAYKKTTKLDGTAPMMIEAYGSYGMSSDPYFSITKASLLERGWVIGTAHPRGGGEMGWSWHKSAKLMTKHRTYEDVIACIDTVVKKKYADRKKIALVGGSAGGMMVGAVLNMRPDCVGAAIAYVPAADVVTSSLDESLGGTRLHYDETGDPRKLNVYKYLMRYSPYENVRKAVYPALLVRANMNDIRTPYWEAAKWVARLRAKKMGDHPLLFKTETVAGHFGKSGRYEWIKDRAFDFAFLMQVFGLR